MRIDQLKYFLEAAQTGSINATAQHLFISQQGVSDALKRMEIELGLTLFQRSKSGISLTKEGEALYDYVKEIVKKYAELENEAMRLRHTEKSSYTTVQPLRLLVNPLSMTVMVPELLEWVKKLEPSLKFSCTDSTTLDKMIQQLQNATADVCFFMLMQADVKTILSAFPKDIKVYKLFEDELVACVDAHSELGKRKNISVSEFDAMDKVLNQKAYTPPNSEDTKFVSNNSDFQLKMILKNQIAAVTIRYFFAKTFPNDTVTALSIKPAYKVNYYVMLPNMELCEGMRTFLSILEQYIYALTNQQVEYHGIL